MSQRDDQVYVGHMIDTANKAIGFVAGLSREDFDDNEQLRLAITHLYANHWRSRSKSAFRLSEHPSRNSLESDRWHEK